MQPKLAIVIHTEEEFDWNNGFYRQNNQVSHGAELIQFCDKILSLGGKITFALDYAFVTSEQGQQVIAHFKPYANQIEFATHLHPWVNPPFATQPNEPVKLADSYPGNLPFEQELAKLTELTNKITQLCGTKPTTYLAGRYGIGNNTAAILKQLGYKTDISISPYTNFNHQQGPDFSHYNNQIFTQYNLLYWPHTTAIVSPVKAINQWFSNNPAAFEQWQQSLIKRLLLKIARIKRQRLSPEGFSLADLKTITTIQCQQLKQSELILSFHSPSVKPGLTPYVNTKAEAEQFLATLCDYLHWFKTTQQGACVLVKSIQQEQ